MHKALHRPLTVCGVDRRLFFLALLMGAATFNLFYSFLAGLLVSLGLYVFALVGDETRPADASHPAVVLALPARYDPAKHDPVQIEVRAMVRIRRILRDYEEAGSLNSLIALWGFVDDHTFLTKAGHLGLVYRLAGVDFECLDHAQRRDIVHRYEAALRCLDESCRVYQYLSKRRMPPIVPAPCRQPVVHEAVHRRAAYLNARRDELFELDLYLVLVYEGLRPHRSVAASSARPAGRIPRAAVREWLSPRATLALLEADLDRAVAQLHHKAAALRGAARRQRPPDAASQGRRLSVLPAPRELHAAPGRGRGACSTTRTWTTSSPTARSSATATTWNSTRRGSRC